jgi:hypothetical protein
MIYYTFSLTSNGASFIRHKLMISEAITQAATMFTASYF